MCPSTRSADTLSLLCAHCVCWRRCPRRFYTSGEELGKVKIKHFKKYFNFAVHQVDFQLDRCQLFPQISPNFLSKFSISSQPGWQAGTIKATLSPPLSFALKYNPHLANNLDIHLPGTPCLTADDFWPLLWEGPAVVVASKTCTTSNWPQDKTFPSAMQLFKKYSQKSTTSNWKR